MSESHTDPRRLVPPSASQEVSLYPAGLTPDEFPPLPPDESWAVDLRYVLDLVASLPVSYKIGLVCLAALLYHAIRRSLDRKD